MKLEHEFTVPVAIGTVWRALLDIEGIAPCMPGATVDSVEGDTVHGSVKVKLGPVALTYRGTATFLEKDEAAHRMVLTAHGKELRGQGTAKATVTGTLTERDGGTAALVATELAVTGRPAQFGRGVMNEVSDRLIGQFADRLSARLAGGGPEAGGGAGRPVGADSAAAQNGKVAPATPVGGAQDPPLTPAQALDATVAPQQPEAEPIDLLRTAGLPVAKRLAGAGVLFAAVCALVAVLVRRRRR